MCLVCVLNESGEQIAVVANQIIQARHRLDPRQQKVIAWAIGQIARDDQDFLCHRLEVSEFAKLTGSESGSLFKEMEQVTTSLLRSILEIREAAGNRARTKFQWLSKCVYTEGEGVVELQFHSELKPYLLELKSRFTQLRLERFFRFRSSYTMRFFERIEMERGLNRLGWSATTEELWSWLGLEPGTYAKFGAFRANVLDIAARELTAKSDYSFTFETVKTGRRITGVQFSICRAGAPRLDPCRERWKRASVADKSRVLTIARLKSRWADMSDQQILDDGVFFEHLPRLLDEAAGQTSLPV